MRGAGALVATVGVLGALGLLGACEPPPFKLKFAYQDGEVQPCGTDRCELVPVGCDAVVEIRIISPLARDEPHVSVCELVENRGGTVCAFADVDLPRSQVPNETLEVQVMVWPRSAVRETSPGVFDCKEIYGQQTSIDFDAQGFPKGVAPTPALGGRAFFHPGDEDTVVTLGCTDLDALNRDTCGGEVELELKAKVNEFSLPLRSVSSTAAKQLRVAMVPPTYVTRSDSYEVSLADTRALDPAPEVESSPRWGKTITNFQFPGSACLEVEPNNQSVTGTLTCQPVLNGERVLDFTGTRLSGDELEKILLALGYAEVPYEGITIGMLVDGNGAVEGVQIQTEPVHHVVYLSRNRDTGTLAIDATATATTDTGMFVSLDAPFDTQFRALGPQAQVASAVGGRVVGRVTIAVLQFQ